MRDAATHNACAPRRRRGVGIACMWYGCGNTALPNPSTMRIALARDGTLTFFNGAVDIGQGSSTVLTQIAADALGLPPEAFRLVVGDTGADGGRRQDLRLAPDLRLRQRRAARRPGSAPEDPGACQCRRERAALALEGATLVDPRRRRPRAGSISAALAGRREAARSSKASAPGTRRRPPLDADGQGVPYATYGFAAQMAEVEVDMVLGTTKVLRMVAAHDVGRAINPTLVEGQIHGGIAQGLGLALMEEFIPGRTENLHDYLIPTVGDMPAIEIRSDRGPGAGGPLRRQGRRRAGADRHRAGDPLRHPPRHRRRAHARPGAAAPAVGGDAPAPLP